MPPRLAVRLTIGLALLAGPAAAAVALGTASGVPGVELHVDAGGKLVVAFTPQAQSVHAQLVGKRIGARCADEPGWPRWGDGARARSASVVVGASTVLATPVAARGRAYDTCTVHGDVTGGWTTLATLTLSARGRLAADLDPATADALVALSGARAFRDSAGRFPSHADLASVLGRVEALASPDASPGPGRIGYWSDGSAAVAVAVSEAGRRVVARLDGEVLETNAFGRVPLRPAAIPAPAPWRARRPFGVVVQERARGLVRVRFTAAADRLYAGLAGKELGVSCNGPAGGFGGSFTLSRRTLVIPPHPQLKPPAGTRYWDACTLSRPGGATLATVILRPPARVRVDRQVTRQLVRSAIVAGRALRQGRSYATPGAVVARGRGLIVALPGPGAAPPRGRAGYWSDGADRAYAAMRTERGELLFARDDGATYGTNVFFESRAAG